VDDKNVKTPENEFRSERNTKKASVACKVYRVWSVILTWNKSWITVLSA